MCLKEYVNFNHPKILKRLKEINKKIAEGGQFQMILVLVVNGLWEVGIKVVFLQNYVQFQIFKP